MQTFLPLESFSASAKVLDRQRLGKQRLEAWQILQTLIGTSSGWANHPAVKMWRGHEKQLALYGFEICEEWISRGYKDTMQKRFIQIFPTLPLGSLCPPRWIGSERFHLSHKQALIAKLPEHYGPLWPGLEGKIDYVWPD